MTRKLKCWTRKASNKKNYVVCSGSKGQKRRKSKRLRNKRQRGGKVTTFVGSPWTSNPSTWPGAAGIAGTTNYYSLAKNNMPFPEPSSQSGGRKLRCWTRKASNKKNYVVCSGSKGQKRRKSKRLRNKRQRGGKGTTLLPQSLVNAGRAIQFQTQSLYNGFRGLPAPVNPNPDVQPAMEKSAKTSFNTDKISTIYNSAQKQVGAI